MRSNLLTPYGIIFGARNEKATDTEGHQVAIFIVPDGLPEKYFVEQMYRRCIIPNLKKQRQEETGWRIWL